MTARLRNTAQLADRVLEEGRLVLQGLRSPKQHVSSLGQAFAAVPSELGFPKELVFRVVVKGQERELSAALWEEVYRIGREAIVNAHRHSRAKEIEACIEYRASVLRIAVRDDGCGFDQPKLASGGNGHLGLQGMCERSERIGGRLRIWSRSALGTEVELRVPGRVAFQAK